jgi:hypothetical protein
MFQKCHQCGLTVQVPSLKREFEYTGYLKGWLPRILELYDAGNSPEQISDHIIEASAITLGEWRTIAIKKGVPVRVRSVVVPPLHVKGEDHTTTIKYVLKRMGRLPPSELPSKYTADAYGTHALILRREGLTFAEIGRRMGVTGGRASQIVARAIRKEKGEEE